MNRDVNPRFKSLNAGKNVNALPIIKLVKYENKYLPENKVEYSSHVVSVQSLDL